MMNFALAQNLLTAALEHANKNNFEVAIAIVDSHGELVSFARKDGCSLQAALLAQNKAYTAARDRQPSANLGKWAQETGKDMGYWTDGKITGLGGGLPVYLNGKVIGAIGISGLSEQEDEAIASMAIAQAKEQALS